MVSTHCSLENNLGNSKRKNEKIADNTAPVKTGRTESHEPFCVFHKEHAV